MFILGWGHRTKFQTLAVGRVGGWDLLRIMPLRGPSCKIELARFSARLRIQDGAECADMWKRQEEPTPQPGGKENW